MNSNKWTELIHIDECSTKPDSNYSELIAHPYFIICLICRFIVIAKRIKKYISSIGQKTGISNILNRVATNDMIVALVAEYLIVRHDTGQQTRTHVTEYTATYSPELEFR